MNPLWFQVENADEIPSPALLLYLDRIVSNVRRMIQMADGPERLRPHAKTCKIPEIVEIQLDQGITRFKCATLAEAEMLAAAGSPDVLLAYQPVGPQVQRLIQLIAAYPETRFSTIADHPDAVRALAAAAQAEGIRVPVYLDIDCGMHRCGVEVGPAARELYRLIHALPSLEPAGLHVYDGHLHDTDPTIRRARCDDAFAPVWAFRAELLAAGLPVPGVVAGGSPTFPFHASDPRVECSPGTTVLWDAGYSKKLPDLPFLPAAAVLTRVISIPGPGQLTLDLGHKAVAAEMPQPRAIFPQLPEAELLMHSEEHLVLRSARASQFKLGDVLYAIPWHVCPTVALHAEASVVDQGRVSQHWEVTARARKLSV